MREVRVNPEPRSVLTAALVACMTIAGFLLQSCDGNGGLLGSRARAWVAIEPIQCLGNSWERDWLERHGNNYGGYPRDMDSQKTIIWEYYGRLGIGVDAVVSRPKYQVTCDACGCPRGDTLFLLVDEQSAGAMVCLGYRREEPRWPLTAAR